LVTHLPRAHASLTYWAVHEYTLKTRVVVVAASLIVSHPAILPPARSIRFLTRYEKLASRPELQYSKGVRAKQDVAFSLLV